jgi:hypothetical protein
MKTPEENTDNSCNNFAKKYFYFLIFFYFSSRKFGLSATSPVSAVYFFLCLFWVPGGQIDFRLEGILNL